ncbi:hypothetical protein BMW22_15565 [Rhizobium leguminosarum]|uniref:Uncharacterized protein n=1 Tax=Rhizobium leguminosarum TaxID=384 RepID=A0A1L3ZB21_RHILE|nr:hypothetical protein [Rhizobium leguminosarum]API52843.1 hypothetical protein BMW22_15565 [Rhizobium leguminosarum]
MFGFLDALKLGAGLAAGLVVYHLYAVSIGYPSAAREARAGYVLESEKAASDALVKKLQRDIILGQQIREQADKEAEQLDIQEQKRRAADEKAIADDKGDGPLVTADDLRWLDSVRKSR